MTNIDEVSQVTRYVVTHINKQGFRTLAHSQQGRCTYATEEEAQSMIVAIMKNNSMSTIKSVYGLPLLVRPCRCWPVHFDPKQIYFDMDEE